MSKLRDRIDWVPGDHRPRPTRAGLAAFAVLGLLLVVAFGGWRPWAGGGRVVRAEVASADQLVPGRTPVRVAGVKVGLVDAVERGRDGKSAIVVMKLTDDAVSVRRDASAAIRLRTVLGGTRYIDLDPGSPSAAPLGDARIALSQTTTQVDWDDITQIMEGHTRLAQRRALAGFRDGLADPPAAARTIGTLGPSLDVIGRSTDALRGQQRGDLPRLVAATAQTVDALSRSRGALERLVAGGARTLTATDRPSLGETVALTPPALDATLATMPRIDSLLDRLDPLVEDLRPGARALAPATRALRPALDETAGLLYDARPILGDLSPAVRDLAAAARQGVPLLNALDPTVKRLNGELLPWLRETDDGTKLRNYEAIGPLFAVLDSAAADYDANGWFFHFPITPTGDTVLLPCGPALTPGELTRCDALNDVLSGVFGGGTP
ncbi:MAG: phospholipid/cholesterol/gamma-HCH transport system substrate-binding protein [Solirubrobacteraceae bacterium]|jgi:phospholipid/cholesterol/gamma-HCH transport system substrate-binding protein|nr:phospholipid/cholesterol/gamma-HCH transport system substrate-binding protein [Solirubrobacteraceae bacterium]